MLWDVFGSHPKTSQIFLDDYFFWDFLGCFGIFWDSPQGDPNEIPKNPKKSQDFWDDPKIWGDVRGFLNVVVNFIVHPVLQRLQVLEHMEEMEIK